MDKRTKITGRGLRTRAIVFMRQGMRALGLTALVKATLRWIASSGPLRAFRRRALRVGRLPGLRVARGGVLPVVWIPSATRKLG